MSLLRDEPGADGSKEKPLEGAIRAEGGRRLVDGPRLEPPLVSIITVVFNAAAELRPLVESVLERTNAETEFVIIDGGSTDGTVELLREYGLRVDYWLSEPDTGIYDAMNKGIAAAKGTYVLHLNAGDRLVCLPMECLRSCKRENVDIATFRVSIDDREIFIPKTGFALKLSNTWHHQGTFYRRDIHPGYDSAYKIFGDMHANQRLLKEGRSVKRFDIVVADHRNDGISNSGRGVRELYQSIRSNFGSFYLIPAFLRFKYLGMRERLRRSSPSAVGLGKTRISAAVAVRRKDFED